jgi:hypothetical protein
MTHRQTDKLAKRTKVLLNFGLAQSKIEYNNLLDDTYYLPLISQLREQKEQAYRLGVKKRDDKHNPLTRKAQRASTSCQAYDRKVIGDNGKPVKVSYATWRNETLGKLSSSNLSKYVANLTNKINHSYLVAIEQYDRDIFDTLSTGEKVFKPNISWYSTAMTYEENLNSFIKEYVDKQLLINSARQIVTDNSNIASWKKEATKLYIESIPRPLDITPDVMLLARKADFGKAYAFANYLWLLMSSRPSEKFGLDFDTYTKWCEERNLSNSNAQWVLEFSKSIFESMLNIKVIRPKNVKQSTGKIRTIGYTVYKNYHY